MENIIGYEPARFAVGDRVWGDNHKRYIILEVKNNTYSWAGETHHCGWSYQLGIDYEYMKELYPNSDGFWIFGIGSEAWIPETRLSAKRYKLEVVSEGRRIAIGECDNHDEVTNFLLSIKAGSFRVNDYDDWILDVENRKVVMCTKYSIVTYHCVALIEKLNISVV